MLYHTIWKAQVGDSRTIMALLVCFVGVWVFFFFFFSFFFFLGGGGAGVGGGFHNQGIYIETETCNKEAQIQNKQVRLTFICILKLVEIPLK